MKSLFNDYEAFNKDANDLSDMVGEQVKNWIEEFAAKGYKRRDIEYVIHSAVSVASSDLILNSALAKRKKDRIKD